MVQDRTRSYHAEGGVSQHGVDEGTGVTGEGGGGHVKFLYVIRDLRFGEQQTRFKVL